LDNALSQLFDLSQAFSVNDYPTPNPTPTRTWNLPIAGLLKAAAIGQMPQAFRMILP